MLVFLVQFMRELRVFAALKSSGNTKDANELFFHSFVGSIIYGHGELKGMLTQFVVGASETACRGFS